MKTQATKTFNTGMGWIEKKTQTQILVCECGNKYIKTRPKQPVCLRCVSRNSKSDRKR